MPRALSGPLATKLAPCLRLRAVLGPLPFGEGSAWFVWTWLFTFRAFTVCGVNT